MAVFFRKAKNIISVLLLIVTFLLVVFMLFTKIQGKTPQLFGYQILRVSSGSMSPVLNVGDVLLSKRVKDITEVKIGDIITYNGEFGSYAGKTITHEVCVEPYESGGIYYLQTMGIANNYPDPEISEDQVVGKMVCVIPFLGIVYNFFMTPWGLIVVLAFLGLLFINELFALKQLSNESDDKAVVESIDSKDVDISDYQD